MQKIILSLGLGVQSSTMLLMADRGEIEPLPDAAIFSDVGDDPRATYAYFDYLQKQIKRIPIFTTSRGKLSQDFLNGIKEARPPLFARSKPGGAPGMLGRQCTRNYKVRQVRRAIRSEVLGVESRAYIAPGSVSCWIGISTDEAIRAKSADVAWLENRHPLIELGMSREDCETWLKKYGYVQPPKSSCVYCPFRTNESFRKMKKDSPEDWADAVAFDRKLRSPEVIKNNSAELFVHRTGIPLENVDLRTQDERGLLAGFAGECEGMCGN